MPGSIFTPELRSALAEQAGRPLRVFDPDTNRAYLIVPAELFDRMVPDDSQDSPGPAHEQRNGAATDGQGPRDSATAAFPAVGTPEWGQMNQRRAELIRKKVRGELTGAERREYEWLQRKSLEALDAAHPRAASGDSAG